MLFRSSSRSLTSCVDATGDRSASSLSLSNLEVEGGQGLHGPVVQFAGDAAALNHADPRAQRTDVVVALQYRRGSIDEQSHERQRVRKRLAWVEHQQPHSPLGRDRISRQ